MTRTCLRCGVEFEGRADARYHSVACRVAAKRSRDKASPTPATAAAPGPLQSLHPLDCPSCSRRIGERTGDELVLVGRWTRPDHAYRWNAYADSRQLTVTLPAVVACPSCRAEVAA